MALTFARPNFFPPSDTVTRLPHNPPAFTMRIRFIPNYFPPDQTKAIAMKSLVPFVLACLPLLISAGCSEYDNAAEESGSTMTQNETEQEVDQIDRSNQVLRHAVFFSFKEESSEADIQSVAEAFEALPSKIDSIIDFSWGTNNSPENLNDGFTHCFLLTFKDAAGRATYLPHPDHKSFGDVLRPHMKDVFVIDWWGAAELAMPESALQHVVFFKFKDDAAAEDVKAVEAGFAELPAKIDAIKRFEWGTNNSPEKHDDNFTHAFLVTFENEEGRETYLPHPAHLAFVDVLKPVLDKVRVLDFTVSK